MQEPVGISVKKWQGEWRSAPVEAFEQRGIDPQALAITISIPILVGGLLPWVFYRHKEGKMGR